MPDLVALRAANADRWAHAKLTRGPEFSPVAKLLCAPKAKERYLAVSARTGVPWFVIAVIHERECTQSWMRSIAQGDFFDSKSIHVPAGRGPFTSWEDAAVDALVGCAPYAARNKDWSIGGILTLLEQYNGLGYASKGLSSPYVWSGTNIYVAGKNVADHVFDPKAVDKQLGCAGLIMAMAAIDATVQAGSPASNVIPFVRKTAQPVVAPHPDSVAPKSSITNPAPGSLGAFIAHLFKKAA
jgi:lysozyme family protein